MLKLKTSFALLAGLCIGASALAQGQDNTSYRDKTVSNPFAGGSLAQQEFGQVTDTQHSWGVLATGNRCSMISCVMAMPDCQEGYEAVNIAKKGACCAHYVCKKKRKDRDNCPAAPAIARICADGSAATVLTRKVRGCPMPMQVCPEDTCIPPGNNPWNGGGGQTNWTNDRNGSNGGAGDSGSGL